MTNYISAIQSATGNPTGLIERILKEIKQGIIPQKYPGSMQHEITICYLAIRAYEKQSDN